MAVNNHGSRISDQANVNSGHVQVHRRRIIVRRHHGYGLALLVLLPEVREGHALVWVLGLWAAVDSVFRDIAHTPEKGCGRIEVFFEGRCAEGFTE